MNLERVLTLWAPSSVGVFLIFWMIFSAYQNTELQHLLQHEAQGYIEGDFTYIASSQPGKISTMPVSRGSEVKKGQVLFTIEAEPRSFNLENAQASLEQAKDNLLDLINPQKRPSEQASIMAQIQSAEADVLYSNTQLERNKYLIKTEAVQQQAVDQAQDQATQALGNLKDLQSQLATSQLSARINQIKAAEAQVEVAQSFLDQAAWDLDQTIVRAPADAFVVDNLYLLGEEVPAETPVVTLLYPSQIKVLFYAPGSFLRRLKLGDPIYFSDSMDPNYKGVAKLTYISPQAEYTPPVIYSRDRDDDLIYRFEADFSKPAEAIRFHTGQPITIYLSPQERKENYKTSWSINDDPNDPENNENNA